jgi:hypothetical protein
MIALMCFAFFLDGFPASADESIVEPSEAPCNDDDDDADDENDVVLQKNLTKGGDNTAKLDAVLYQSVE